MCQIDRIISLGGLNKSGRASRRVVREYVWPRVPEGRAVWVRALLVGLLVGAMCNELVR